MGRSGDPHPGGQRAWRNCDNCRVAFAGDQYDIESFDITLTAITEVGPDLTWLIYVLVGAIVGVIGVFSAYQLHFKYPSMVRKVRKIKKSVKKGRKTKPILVSKREEILKNNFEEHKKLLELELVKPEILDNINKNSFKKRGRDVNAQRNYNN